MKRTLQQGDLKRVKINLFFKLVFFIFACLPLFSKAQKKVDSVDLSYKKIRVDDYNGSAFTIKGDQLQSIPISSLTNLLTGLVPGFFSYQTSGGTVNEAPQYWIRGVRTSAEGVLTLVDGQERDFSVLSPYEIESITVLKDGLGTALYGTRAANGVILVNTRKGVKGKPSVQLTMQAINQEPIGMLKPVNALTYAEQYNEALKYDAMDATNMYSQNYLRQYRNRAGVNAELYPDVNWLDDYYKKSSLLQRYNLSITGGAGRTRYYINGGFLAQDGMFKTDKIAGYSTNNNTSRFNFRSNLEVDVTPTTLLNVDLYGWHDSQNRPGGDSYGVYDALVTTPANSFPPFYYDNGSYVDEAGNTIKGVDGKIVAGNAFSSNPWALLNRNGYSIRNLTYGSFRTKLTQNLPFLLNGLKASLMLSMDSYTDAVTDREKEFAYYRLADINNPSSLRKTGIDDQMSNSVVNTLSQARNSLEFQLTYEHQFKESHNLSALAFYNQYEYNTQVAIPNRFQTLGSWVNYNYKHKYSVDFTGSYQGIYKFAPGKRFGFFPAVGMGWTVSNESFLEPLKDYLSYLKLRGSYGLIGNQRGVSEFQYIGRLTPVSGVYNFGGTMAGVGGYVEDIIANPDLTWEKAKQLNAGADIRLFRDKLSMSFDYFRDKRDDMYLTNNNITSLLATEASIKQNIGRMNSRGYESAIFWNDKMGSVGYSLGATYSYFENNIEQTGDIAELYPYLQDAGYSRGIERGYVALGLFQSYEEIAASPTQTFSTVSPGDIKYKDINGDGLIDRNDYAPIGYGNVPRVFYSFFGGLSYRNFGFNIQLQGADRVTRYMSSKVAIPFISNGNMYEHQLDYWTPDHPEGKWPNISTQTSGVNNSQRSSFWLRDAGYLRLKTAEIYYNFPKKVLKGMFIKDLRVFVNGYNLYVWSKYDSPLDPEDTGDANSMPLTRNISAGLSIKF